MLTTLNGMFSKPKPHRINFIKENKRKLKEISSMVNQNQSKSRFDLTKSQSSQTEVSKNRSSSGLKENRNKTVSSSRLSCKGSTAVFTQDKRDKGSISNCSLSAKQKSSQRIASQKNQSCQTIDPRRYDQLFHEGVIKYPSNKVMQQLAEVEKQKANRLDAHVKKEYFRRNKIKHRSPNRFLLPKVAVKGSGKGDEGEDKITASESNEDDEDKEDNDSEEEEEEPEVPETKSAKPSPQPQTGMRAAEIIRRTTEEHFSPRGHPPSNHIPNSTGDAKPKKKNSRKLSQEDELLKTVLDPQCPPGHIPLPDSERKKTLHMLRVSHAELVREMNLLPVRADTLRVRQRKIHLENQLNKIEEGIKVFNKSKVYVKIEE